METKYFATFDEDGFPTGFYPSDIFVSAPAGAIEISKEQWQEFLEHQGERRWEDGEVVAA